ncbi:MAG: type II secretion system protein [Candidatus Omnitrophota bacterium]
MKGKGFTLLELIISGAIIVLVSVTVYSVFSGGIAVWKKAYLARNQGHKLRLAIDKMSVEVRNSFRFSSIPFEGTEDSVSFPSVCEGNVSRVSYFLNEDKVFCRAVESYAQVFKKDEQGSVYAILSPVAELKFSYCYLDNASGEYKWKDDWVRDEQDTLPRALRVELFFGEKAGEEADLVKTIFIPIGTGGQKKELVQ